MKKEENRCLIVDGNAVYEIDRDCTRKKAQKITRQKQGSGRTEKKQRS